MKKLTYIVDKNDNQPFKVVNAALMKQELDSLPKGRYKLSVEKLHRKATPKQFGYLFGYLYPLMLQAAYENGYTTDDFKDIEELDLWAKARWANKAITNRDTGEVMKIPISKAKFVTIDEMLYVNTIRDFLAEYWGVVTLDPNPNWKNKGAKSQE